MNDNERENIMDKEKEEILNALGVFEENTITLEDCEKESEETTWQQLLKLSRKTEKK